MFYLPLPLACPIDFIHRLLLFFLVDLRNYKFRLYPTRRQEEKLVETLDGGRWVYNYFLDKEMSKYDMHLALTELKRQHDWLYNYHSKMLQMVVSRIDSARKTILAHKRKGRKIGKLHYHFHEQHNSFIYNQSGFRIENNSLWLSKIGSIRIRLHRQPFNVKQVIVCRQASTNWYAIVTCEIFTPIFRFVDPRSAVGIDLGITKFIHDSENREIEHPSFLTKQIKPLRRAHRRLSRRKRGSNNYGKAKNMLAKLYSRIHNQRNNFLHEHSTMYSRRHDIIFLERLQTLNLVKNHRISRYVFDSGWRTFKSMLEYKSKMVIEVEPAYTSIDCSTCGSRVPKSLAVRRHRCDKCGLTIDRDYNASMNILKRGLSSLMSITHVLYGLPQELREVTLVETAQRSRKQEAHDEYVRGQLTPCR
jgi:putative transposase